MKVGALFCALLGALVLCALAQSMTLNASPPTANVVRDAIPEPIGVAAMAVGLGMVVARRARR